jgi:hypothetical protein
LISLSSSILKRGMAIIKKWAHEGPYKRKKEKKRIAMFS